jgi:hypothetical protein
MIGMSGFSTIMEGHRDYTPPSPLNLYWRRDNPILHPNIFKIRERDTDLIQFLNGRSA